MTVTRKLFALSAISALSFALTACGDDGGSKNDSTPTPTPSAECTADACADGVTLNKCVDGKIVADNCGAKGQICANNACADKPADAAECTADACDADGVTWLQCVGGKINKVNCGEAGKICSDNKCADKPAEETKCTDADTKCKDNTTLNKCDADSGKITEVNCAQSDGICENNDCVKIADSKCTKGAKMCNLEDAYMVCDDKGKWGEPQKCGDNQICQGDGECKEKPAAVATIIGQPCSCTGNDCKIEITGKELKAALSPTIIGLAPTLKITLPEDTDVISAPNYFSSSIKGCDGLKAPDGMAVGCFYSDKITVPPSVSGLLGSVESILSNPYVAGMLGGLAESIKEVDLGGMLGAAQKLLEDGIQFQAKNGYCLLADIDIALNVSDPMISGFIKMDEVNKLVNKINTPNHDHSKAKSATCPDGSVLLSYTVDKESDKGGAKVGFDMCLKSCTKATEKTDCRVADGYSCVKLPKEVAEEGKTAEEVEVCFDQKNIDYFTKITEDFEQYFPKKEGE